MQDWAARYDCTIKERTEVGFGRPAVGVFYGDAFVEYHYELRIWTPEDAYHKWDSIVVLVHDDQYDRAMQQLYDWIVWLDENKFGVEIGTRQTMNERGSFGAQLEIMMNGRSQPNLVKL